ncbi:uncharacterized protein TM35_000143050 [Trypanosoma theileri]|uniref:Uncharacterized protein n=1 Tax=Trypanosoma theileri TaxID=67003 RepID=A0A1X0NWL1_9TRYP|nr:uncharacterized protein TM35_000143050 [Trypanosoma theileri]ORC89094.1 hypothetical protein TM35_000143050 [Trypanosoma theileri]
MKTTPVRRFDKLLEFTLENRVLVRCLKTLGIGVSSSLCCQQSCNGSPIMTLSTSSDIPSAFPLVVVPDTSVWTVGSVHDDDIEGFMPTPETCLAILTSLKKQHLLDVFFLSLCFSFNACRKCSMWSTWQIQQVLQVPMDHTEDSTTAEFLRSLSQHNLTPPLDIFRLMLNYTLFHSFRLSKDGMCVQRDGPILAVIPMVDVAVTEGINKGNLTLQRSTAEGTRTLLKKNSLLYVKQGLQRRSSDATYWVLQTARCVKKGERLTFQPPLKFFFKNDIASSVL